MTGLGSIAVLFLWANLSILFFVYDQICQFYLSIIYFIFDSFYLWEVSVFYTEGCSADSFDFGVLIGGQLRVFLLCYLH